MLLSLIICPQNLHKYFNNLGDGAMPATEETFSIGTVERDTGISRDTLRIWERRYGYPQPLRNAKGERIYPESQLRHLQKLRRFLDQGMRPGKLLRLTEAEFMALESASSGAQTETLSSREPLSPLVVACLTAVQQLDEQALIDRLELAHQQYGMANFIRQIIAPCVTTVGDAWARGDIEVYQEHFFTQVLTQYLNIEIAKMRSGGSRPLVLLGSLPSELHTLGLSMTAAMLACHGLACIQLGASMPVDQLSKAAQEFNVNIVGVSFSSAYPYNNIHNDIRELRDSVPGDIDIWVGGEGVRKLRKLPVGVRKFTDFAQLPL